MGKRRKEQKKGIRGRRKKEIGKKREEWIKGELGRQGKRIAKGEPESEKEWKWRIEKKKEGREEGRRREERIGETEGQ